VSDLIDLMNEFEMDLGASAEDSVHRIARRFARAQTRFGATAAIEALATTYVISETRRRHLEAELLAKLLCGGHSTTQEENHGQEILRPA
jgi:hypothetical protein